MPTRRNRRALVPPINFISAFHITTDTSLFVHTQLTNHLALLTRAALINGGNPFHLPDQVEYHRRVFSRASSSSRINGGKQERRVLIYFTRKRN